MVPAEELSVGLYGKKGTEVNTSTCCAAKRDHKKRSKMAKARDKDMTFTAAPQTDKEATTECGRAKEKIKIAGNKT